MKIKVFSHLVVVAGKRRHGDNLERCASGYTAQVTKNVEASSKGDSVSSKYYCTKLRLNGKRSS
jgi:hypothetical protein